MEQQTLYDTTDMSAPVWGQPIVGTLVDTLMCPSDSTAPDDVSLSRNIAWTNYAGATAWDWWGRINRMIGTQNVGGIPLPKPLLRSDGVFMADNTSTIEDITDGTSNTLIVAECNYASWMNGRPWANGSGVPRYTRGVSGGNEPLPRCAFVAWDAGGTICTDPKYQAYDGGGCKWIGGWNPGFWGPSFLTHEGFKVRWSAAGGMHPGVMNILMGDGSARSLSDSTSYEVYFCLCAMADGETLGDRF
jgi:prepilin-type processing-associated H-X9-DG protein